MKKNRGIKERIYELIQIGNESDLLSKSFDFFLIGVIILSIVVTFILTFDWSEKITGLLHGIELFTIVIFTIEYILRVWTADYLHPDKTRLKATLMFIFSFTGIVDLLTIIPYFAPFFLPGGVVAFRMFRIVRILHLFRINANYDAFNVITDVLKEKKNQLISSVFLIAVLVLAASICMYDLEHDAQPDTFTNAFSGTWWAVSTLLTVGYGDLYPMTVAGRIIAIFIAFLGVGVVAIPTGIISAGFVEYYTKIKTGTYASKDADFITLEIDRGHPFVGRMLKELDLPRGLYVAVVIKGDDVLNAYDEYHICEGDSILFGTSGTTKMEGRLEEVTLVHRHPWIGVKIKNLDISRQCFVVMVKRGAKNLKPEEGLKLNENDILLLLEKKR